MKRRVLLATLIVLALAVISAAFAIYKHYLSLRADREFGALAQIVQQNMRPFSSLRAQIAIDDAERGALGLRTARKRELALRWLEAQRELRSTLLEWIDADVQRKSAERPCWEQIGLPGPEADLKNVSPQALVNLLNCQDPIRKQYERETRPLATKAKRLQADATSLWVRLVAIAPEIARSQPD